MNDLEVGSGVTIRGVSVFVNSVTPVGNGKCEVSITYKNNSGEMLTITPYDWSSVSRTGSDKAHVGGDGSFHLENIYDGEEWSGIVTLWRDSDTEKIKFESSDLNLLEDVKLNATWNIPPMTDEFGMEIVDTPVNELQDLTIRSTVTMKGVSVTVNSVIPVEDDRCEVNITYKNNSGDTLSLNPYDWSSVLRTGSDKAHVGGDCSFHLETLDNGEEWTGIVTLWYDENTEKVKFESVSLNLLEDNTLKATWMID